MPIYEIQTPDGRVFEIDGPRPPTHADIQKMQVRGVFGPSGRTEAPDVAPPSGMFDTSQPMTGREFLERNRRSDFGVAEAAAEHPYLTAGGLALIGGGPTIGRAIAGRGLSAAQRAIESARAAGTVLTPVVKYEVAHQAMVSAGVPEVVAVPLAMGIAGLRGKKPAPTPAPAQPQPAPPAPQAPPTPAVNPVAAGMASGGYTPRPAPQPQPPVVAAPAPQPAPTQQPTQTPTPAPRRPPDASYQPKSWTPEEVSDIVRLKEVGVPHDVAVDAVLSRRGASASPVASSPAAPAPQAVSAAPESVSAPPVAAPPTQAAPPVHQSIRVLPGETLTLPPSARTQGQMSRAAIQNDMGLANRRLGANLSDEEYAEARALFHAGRSPVDAVQEVASRRPAAPAAAQPAPEPAAPSEPPRGVLPDELQEYVRLRQAGKTHKAAVKSLEQQRELASIPGAVPVGEMRARVSRRLAGTNRTSEELEPTASAAQSTPAPAPAASEPTPKPAQAKTPEPAPTQKPYQYTAQDAAIIGKTNPPAPTAKPEVAPYTREEWLAQVGDPAKTRAEAEALMDEAQKLYDTIKGQMYTANKQLRKQVPPEAHRVMQQVNDLRAQAGKLKDKAYAQQRMHDDPHSQMRPETTLAGAKNYSADFGRDEARAAAALKQWEAASAKPAETTVVKTPARKPQTPAAAAEKVQSQVNKVIDVQGAKSAADVQKRVIAALEEELPAARQAQKFGDVEIRPRKAYGGREFDVFVNGNPVLEVDRYGKMQPHYGVDDDMIKALGGTPVDPGKYGARATIPTGVDRLTNMTPTEAHRAVRDQIALRLSRASEAGRLTVQIPGDGAFTIERNPNAINELLARLKSSGANTWRGIVPGEKPLPRRGERGVPNAAFADRPWTTWD